MKGLLLIFTLILCAGAGQAAGSKEMPPETAQALAEIEGLSPVKAADGENVALTPATDAVNSGATTKSAETTKDETQIPLKFEESKKSAAAESPLLRILLGLVVTAGLGTGAFFFLRRYSRPGQKQNAPQIKILTQHWLGPKKSLAIVRVAGESVLIGITDQNINMIKSLALLDEDIPEEIPEKFTGVLQKASMQEEAEQKPAPVATPRAAAQTQAQTRKTSPSSPARPAAANAASNGEEGEDFTISGIGQIRDVVNRRLKNMRNLD